MGSLGDGGGGGAGGQGLGGGWGLTETRISSGRSWEPIWVQDPALPVLSGENLGPAPVPQFPHLEGGTSIMAVSGGGAQRAASCTPSPGITTSALVQGLLRARLSSQGLARPECLAGLGGDGVGGLSKCPSGDVTFFWPISTRELRGRPRKVMPPPELTQQVGAQQRASPAPKPPTP